MIKEIRFSEEFDRAFKRLKKRYRSLPDDVKKLLASLIENPRQGAELYNGMRKVRISCQQFPIPQKYPPRHPQDASALCIRHCLTIAKPGTAGTGTVPRKPHCHRCHRHRCHRWGEPLVHTR